MQIEAMRKGVSAETARSSIQPSSLAPREHGAYGQLGAPLATALLMARPTLASALLAGASVAAFVAHEPLLILLGRRGPRALREDRRRARARLAVLGGAAASLGLAGLAIAPPPARLAALVPSALSAVVAGFIAHDEERTTPGEIVTAIALASAALPVALAADVPLSTAIGALVAWSLAFAASTWSVRMVIAFQKVRLGFTRRTLPLLVPPALAIALSIAGVISSASAAAVAPMALLALGFAAWPPHPRMLNRVGFSLLFSSVVTTAVLVAGAWR